MSVKSREQVEEIRRKFRNTQAKELTPENGVQLREDFRAQYQLYNKRYIAFCIERSLYVWDLFPNQ